MRRATTVGRGLCRRSLARDSTLAGAEGASHGRPNGMFVALNELLGLSVEQPERGVNLLTAKEQNQLVFFEGLKLANQGNLVFLVRSSEASEDEENELLGKALRHQAHSVLWAEGLASGYCKEVHGQLTILEKDFRESSGMRDPRRIYQYQIQDKNVTFFARGMSAAVL
ncbi:hypothetical protein E2320_001443 [Naja naja]|nr:hypothetical protein E2320_001443 [Naja naja]